MPSQLGLGLGLSFQGGGNRLTMGLGTLALTATVAVAYSGTPTITGGVPAYTAAQLTPLPPGLTMNTTTGQITGTPT